MSESVKMPALGESVTEGTVTTWLKQVGDTIEVDEPLVEVATDKVDTEVPSPFAGVIEEILVEEDETVEVGTVLAKIGDGSGASSSDEGEKDETAAKDEPAAAQQEPEEAPKEESSDEAQEAPKEQPKASGSGGGQGQAVEMPALGESVTEGTVTSWLKAEGDTVEVDEPLVEVATDKVDTEVPSPFAGVLQKILVQEDETVDVGTVLAYIGDGSAPAQEEEEEESAPQQDEEKAEAAEPEQKDEPAAAPAEAAAQQEPEAAPKAETPAPAKDDKAGESNQSSQSTAESVSYVTPLVRKLAADKGVVLASLTGTGVGGRIRKQDVLEAAEKAQASSAPAAAAPSGQAAAPAAAPKKPATVAPASDKRGTREKMSRLRQVIARRMNESLETSAQLTTVLEVDMTRVWDLRKKAKNKFIAENGVNLTFLAFIMKATTEALRAHPKLNASIEENEVVYHGAEHIGMAVDTERGLLVPVIKDAGDLNLVGIAKRIADLGQRTRDNKVGPDELAGSTFTITNTGSGGALFDTPIINQPEVGILGTGAIVRRPAVVKDVDGNESIAIRAMCYLSITYDHRLVDGADASRFLTQIKNRLEEGAFEEELGL